MCPARTLSPCKPLQQSCKRKLLIGYTTASKILWGNTFGHTSARFLPNFFGLLFCVAIFHFNSGFKLWMLSYVLLQLVQCLGRHLLRHASCFQQKQKWTCKAVQQMNRFSLGMSRSMWEFPPFCLLQKDAKCFLSPRLHAGYYKN